MTNEQALSREIPLDPRTSGILYIDVQNYCAGPEGFTDGRRSAASPRRTHSAAARRRSAAETA